MKGGGWKWRCNLDTISQFTEEIRGYPNNVSVSPTNTLFLCKYLLLTLSFFVSLFTPHSTILEITAEMNKIRFSFEEGD